MTHHEFTVRGALYRSGGIDPVAQGHVARRLMPLADHLAPMLKKMLQGGQPLLPSEARAGMIDRAMPLIEWLSCVSTETHDFLLDATLAKVERLGPTGRWERIWNDKRGSLTVDGITGADIIEISFIVLAAEMGAFFMSLIERMPKAAMQTPLARHLNG